MRKRRSEQEVYKEVHNGIVVYGEIKFLDSPNTDAFEDYKLVGCSALANDNGTSFTLRVSTHNPAIRELYENGIGDKCYYSVLANDECVSLVCSAGGQEVSVGVFPVPVESYIRKEGIWSRLSNSRVKTVRIGKLTVGNVMPFLKWNELMHGADLVEMMTDEDVTSLIRCVGDTLEAEVYVTEIEVFNVR